MKINNKPERKIVGSIAQGTGTVSSIGFTVPAGCYAEVIFSIRGAAAANTYATYSLNNGGALEAICSVKGLTSAGTITSGFERMVLTEGTWVGSNISNAFTGSAYFCVMGFIYRVN